MACTFGIEKPEGTTRSTSTSSERSTATIEECIETPAPVRYFRKRGKNVDGVERNRSTDSSVLLSSEEKMELRAMRNRVVGAELSQSCC